MVTKTSSLGRICIMALAAVLTVGGVREARAFEALLYGGRPEHWTGEPGKQVTVTYYLNVNVLDYGRVFDGYDFLPGKVPVFATLTKAQRARMVRICTRALNAWSGARGSTVRARLGGTVAFDGPFDGTTRTNTITLIANPPWNGFGPSFLDGSTAGILEAHAFVSFGVCTAGAEDTVIGLVKHELGHTLGLAHSPIDALVASRNGIGSEDTIAAIMSYDRGRRAVPMHLDDEASMATIYPAASRPFAERTMRGRLVDRDGTAIHGANVFLVDARNGKPLMGQISGYDDGNGGFAFPIPNGYDEVHLAAVPLRDEDPPILGGANLDFQPVRLRKIRVPRIRGEFELKPVVEGTDRDWQPNRPPVFDPAPPARITLHVQESLTVDFQATDPDGDRVSYQLQGAPTSAAFDTGTGRLTLTWRADESGRSYRLKVTAKDDAGASSEASPELIVEAQPTNGSATIRWTPDPAARVQYMFVWSDASSQIVAQEWLDARADSEQLQLPPGNYQWTIYALVGDSWNVTVPWTPITLEAQPVNGSATIRWTPDPDARAQYLFVWSDASRQIVAQKWLDARADSEQLQLPPGNYQWTIYALVGDSWSVTAPWRLITL